MAGKLNHRTNNALIQTFKVNRLIQISKATRSGTLTVAERIGNKHHRRLSVKEVLHQSNSELNGKFHENETTSARADASRPVSKVRTVDPFLSYKTRAKDRRQFNATVNYASKHVGLKVAAFVSLTRGKETSARLARSYITRQSAIAGAKAVVLSFDPRELRRKKVK